MCSPKVPDMPEPTPAPPIPEESAKADELLVAKKNKRGSNTLFSGNKKRKLSIPNRPNTA